MVHIKFLYYSIPFLTSLSALSLMTILYKRTNSCFIKASFPLHILLTSNAFFYSLLLYFDSLGIRPIYIVALESALRVSFVFIPWGLLHFLNSLIGLKNKRYGERILLITSLMFLIITKINFFTPNSYKVLVKLESLFPLITILICIYSVFRLFLYILKEKVLPRYIKYLFIYSLALSVLNIVDYLFLDTLSIAAVLFIIFNSHIVKESFNFLSDFNNDSDTIDLNLFIERFSLTKREGEVLFHLLSGMSYKEIANTESVSLATIKTHINNLYFKVGVNSRHELYTAIEGNKKVIFQPKG